MGKQMTVGKRIGVGFTVVILITVAIGGLGVWNMLTAKTESTKLAAEYVPEVKVATDLRGAANRVMYQMRGYGLTEEAMQLSVEQFMKIYGKAKGLPTPTAVVEGEAAVLTVTLDPPNEMGTKVPQIEVTRGTGAGSVLVRTTLGMVEGLAGSGDLSGNQFEYRITVLSHEGKTVAKGVQAKGKTLTWDEEPGE